MSGEAKIEAGVQTGTEEEEKAQDAEVPKKEMKEREHHPEKTVNTQSILSLIQSVLANLTTNSNPYLINAGPKRKNDDVDERKETDEREVSKQNPEPTGDNDVRNDQD